MGIYRLHKNVWERGRSIRISQIQAPEPTDLWNSDGKFDTILKKKQLVERLGIFDIRTGEHSSVCLFSLSHRTGTIYKDCFINKIGGGG